MPKITANNPDELANIELIKAIFDTSPVCGILFCSFGLLDFVVSFGWLGYSSSIGSVTSFAFTITMIVFTIEAPSLSAIL